MRPFLGKLAFIHRRLWQRDAFYPAAVLFGPAPLAGLVVAIGVWGSITEINGWTQKPAAWGAPQKSEPVIGDRDHPLTVPQAGPLPSGNLEGSPAGYEPGWTAYTAPIQVNTTLDVNVGTTRLTVFQLDESFIDMTRIVAEGPKDGLYVGIGLAGLLVRSPGIFGLTARVDRPTAPTASCLVRLSIGDHRVISNLQINLADETSHTYPTAHVDLRPGFYQLAWAFGCWRDQTVMGPGRMTILIQHPNETEPVPPQMNEILRKSPRQK